MKNSKIFNITTLAGFRYQLPMKQLMKSFTSQRFGFFFAISNLLLILFMPLNQTFGLDIVQRFIYWPIMTTGFLGLYIVMIWLGEKYASKKEGRFYYSPFGILIAVMICTAIGAFFVAYLTNRPPDLSFYKGMEVLFNMLLACIFESVFFAITFGSWIEKPNSSDQHPWEDI